MVSFRAPAEIDSFVPVEIAIDLRFSTAPLPVWWRLRDQTGQTDPCRHGSLAARAEFGGAGSGCVVPARETWWGRVKALYR